MSFSCLSVCTCAKAEDFGALTDGTWSEPAIWTPIGGPPDAADNAYIGSIYPLGSASEAHVTLSGNQAVSNLTLGFWDGGLGTLDLAGFDLVVGERLSLGAEGGRGDIIYNGGSLTAERLVTFSDLTFSNRDSVEELSFFSGSIVRTTNSLNVTDSVDLHDFSTTLSLGADLVLNRDIFIEGSPTWNGSSFARIEAHGFDISARNIYVGINGNGGEIVDDGAINARILHVEIGTFSFDVDDSVESINTGPSAIINLHPSTAANALNILAGGTANVVNTGNVRASVSVAGNLNLAADLVLSDNFNLNAPSDLSGHNVTARNVSIGPTGQLLNAGSIVATENWEVNGATFSFDADDSVADTLSVANGGTVNMHANTAVRQLDVYDGGTINTVDSGNVDSRVTVAGRGVRFSRSRLNLGADLVLSGALDINATAIVDANGFNIQAQTVFVGRFRTAGNLVDDGAIQADNLYLDTSRLTLTGGNDDLSVGLGIRWSSTLNIVQANYQLTGLTLDGNSLVIDSTSTLKLIFDGKAAFGRDWAFRWRNPANGNRVDQLTTLVDSGRIVTNSPNATRVFDGGDGYTYIGVVPQ